jgi:hypothetical protein
MNKKKLPIKPNHMDRTNDSETWIDSASDLIDTYRNLISIRVVEHTSQGIAISIIGIIAMVIGVFVMLFTGIGVAWWLGEYLNNMKAGFFIIGVSYLALLLLLLVTSRKIWTPYIRNLIIKKIYEQD